MKVKKNSWHYWLLDFTNSKLLNRLYRGGNVTLCKYFWSVVWAILNVIALSIGLILVLGYLGYGLYGTICGVMYLLSPWIGFYGIFNYDLGCGLSFFVVGVGIIGGIIGYLSDKIDFAPEYLKRPFRKLFTKIGESIPESENKEPNLIVEAYKAHKSKFCPLIEIED